MQRRPPGGGRLLLCRLPGSVRTAKVLPLGELMTRIEAGTWKRNPAPWDRLPAAALALLLLLCWIPARPAPRPADAAAEDRGALLDRAAALRRAGDLDGASALLKALWLAEPLTPDKTVALAYGEICLLRGDSPSAEAPLREAADSRGALSPYGRLLLARWMRGQKRFEEASREAERLAASQAPKSLRQRALRLSAESLEEANLHARAAEAWKRYIALGPSMRQTEGARFRLSLCLERAELWRPAGQALWAIYSAPRSAHGREAGLALGRLAGAGHFAFPSRTPAQTLDFARRLLAAGRREDALDLLDAPTVRALKGDLALEAGYLRVSVFSSLRKNAGAAAEADRLAAAFGSNRTTAQASLKAAWAILREGDHAATVARFETLIAGAGKDEALRAEALNGLGTSAYVHGLFKEALEAFTQVEGLRAAPSTLASASYKRAWCLMKLEDPAGARTIFASLAGRFPKLGLEGPCGYWQARAALAAGDRGGAVDALVREALAPPGYWSGQAREQLALMDLSLPAPPAGEPPPDPWGPSCSGPETALARSLDVAGLEGEAAEAFQPFFARHRRDPSAGLTLALMLARSGRYAAAHAALTQALGPALDSFDAAPSVLEVAYPTPDLALVKAACRREGVDPALALAVIRQESFFDEAAFSPAGAQGLMQIMPDTAQRLSPGGGNGAGGGPPDLLDPSVNLDLGVKYLGQLASRFPTAAAAASYNAGEDIVGPWTSAFGTRDEAEFVGMIPYQETRQYTAQVLWNLREYRRVLLRN